MKRCVTTNSSGESSSIHVFHDAPDVLDCECNCDMDTATVGVAVGVAGTAGSNGRFDSLRKFRIDTQLSTDYSGSEQSRDLREISSFSTDTIRSDNEKYAETNV